jgi:hypothetical protein
MLYLVGGRLLTEGSTSELGEEGRLPLLELKQRVLPRSN